MGGTNSHLGGHGLGMPPRGTRPALMGTKGWFQRSGLSSFEFLLAEGDSVERSDHNVLQGTCCFQLSTAFPFYCYIQRWSPRGRPWPRGRPQGHILKSLASKPEVLGLGLEASSPLKLPCPRLEDSTIFEQLKFRWKTPETSRKICEHLFCFPHLEHRRRQGSSLIEISPMTKM